MPIACISPSRVAANQTARPLLANKQRTYSANASELFRCYGNCVAFIAMLLHTVMTPGVVYSVIEKGLWLIISTLVYYEWGFEI